MLRTVHSGLCSLSDLPTARPLDGRPGFPGAGGRLSEFWVTLDKGVNRTLFARLEVSGGAFGVPVWSWGHTGLYGQVAAPPMPACSHIGAFNGHRNGARLSPTALTSRRRSAAGTWIWVSSLEVYQSYSPG